MTTPARNHPAAIDAIHLRPQAVTAHWVRELRNYARYEAPTPAAAKAAFVAARDAARLHKSLVAAEEAAR